MPEATPTTETKPGAEQTPAAKVDEPKTYDAAYVKQLRDEAKANREKAEAYEAKLATEATAKANAEKAKLEAEGKWKELADAKQKELDALRPNADRAVALEKRLANLRDAEIDGLPDGLKGRLAKMTDYDDAIAIARDFKAQNAGPRAAPAVAGGAPAGSTVPPNFKDMNAAQADTYFKNNPAALKDFMSKRFGSGRDPFGA